MILNNVVPKIRLKITRFDGTEQKYVTRKKMKIVSIIVREPASEWILEVVYGPGIFNSGTFHTKSEVKMALAQWTEKALIDYIEDGEW